MSKNVNKLVAIMTVGVVLSVPMISNAKNVVYSSNVATGTPIATETPSEKEGIVACYFVNDVVLCKSVVDNTVNPTKFWNNKTGEVFESYRGKSINDLVPAGYKFVRWEDTTPDAPEGKVHQVKAILEKDQDYIDKMETSVDFILDDSVSKSYRPVCVKYNDEISKPVSIKVLVTSDNGIFKSEYTLTSDEKYRNAFDSDYSFEEDLTKDVCVFCTCNLSILPGNYTVKVEVTNDLGKVTTAEKTYADKELTKLVDPNSVYLADASKEYYFGDKVYLTNVTKGNSWFIRNLQHDENGYYLVADADFISSYANIATMNLVLHPDMFDPATQVWTLEGNFGAVCTRALKVHNISRDGKSVAFGELPKQQEPETPVEPATKTPEEVVEPATETPAEPATKTPEEVKPAEQATKTPEETKPVKPSNTSDASNVAVALVGLTLTGVVVVKTKKNA